MNDIISAERKELKRIFKKLKKKRKLSSEKIKVIVGFEEERERAKKM